MRPGEHKTVQAGGRDWYAAFRVRVCGSNANKASDPMAEAIGSPCPVLANDLKLESAVDIEPHSDNGMRDIAVPC